MYANKAEKNKVDNKMIKLGYKYVLWPTNQSIDSLYVKTTKDIASVLKSYSNLTFLIRKLGD